jgi:hypothetical protein
VAVAALSAFLGFANAAVPPATAQPNARPHIVFVLTDDQRFDTLWAMPIVLEEIASQGVTFANSIVTTLACGQTRASLLSGGHLSRNNGVLTNGNEGSGGLGRFEDSNSLAVQLQRSGYRTLIVGKYISGWLTSSRYVPPGWTRAALGGGSPLIVGSTGPDAASVRDRVPYSNFRSEAYRDHILAFIDEHLPSGHPLFVYYCDPLPHYEAIPAPQDQALFPS